MMRVVVIGLLFYAEVAAGEVDKSVAFAACTALQALEDIDKSEAALLQEEQSRVKSYVADGLSPISVGETLNEMIGLHLEGALAVLRHALAAGAFGDKSELAEFSALDAQFSALLSAQAEEPLFFWHGPRRLLLPRLRSLLGDKYVSDRLRTSAGDCHGLFQAIEPEDLLGFEDIQEDTPSEALPHGLPLVGIVADDSNCGETNACDLKKVLPEVQGLNGAVPAHIMVLPSSEKALDNIGAALVNATDVFLSLVLPGHFLAGNVVQIVETSKQILAALGRKRVDLLWLPSASFDKPVWAKVQSQLEELLKEGLIGAYGVQADISTGSAAKSLFENRQPAPVAWLMQHDLLRPATNRAVAIARKLGMAIIAQPRSLALGSSVAAAYLRVVSKRPVYPQAAFLRWVLHSGFGLAMSYSGMGEELILQKLSETQVSQAGLQLLDTVHLFSRPDLTTDDISTAVSGELVQSLRQGHKDAAVYAELVGNANSFASSSDGFMPGVGSSTLDDLDEQARMYKKNNKVIYKENFFSEATFAAIVKETQRLWKSDDIEGNCNLDGRNRLGGYVLDHTSSNSSLYKLIYSNEPFRQWVSAVNDEGTMWPSDFPIELREYGEQSQGMGCHPDMQMYAVAKKDLEFAVTVDNDSKCVVTFYDAQKKKHTVHTRPNSVMMVQANAATHCVSPTNGGHRTILKFIYVGDYRKSNGFVHYKGNECGADNINKVALKARREQPAASGSLEL